jgi:predicted metal-binding transcription factor (methanogenesis marker protein 9)
MSSEDLNKKTFSRLVETYVRTHKDCPYMDAIIDVCDKNEIDLRDSKKLISKEIVQHVEFEARELNLLQGGNPTHILPQ